MRFLFSHVSVSCRQCNRSRDLIMLLGIWLVNPPKNAVSNIKYFAFRNSLFYKLTSNQTTKIWSDLFPRSPLDLFSIAVSPDSSKDSPELRFRLMCVELGKVNNELQTGWFFWMTLPIFSTKKKSTNQHTANQKRQCSLINSYWNGDRSTYIFRDNKTVMKKWWARLKHDLSLHLYNSKSESFVGAIVSKNNFIYEGLRIEEEALVVFWRGK